MSTEVFTSPQAQAIIKHVHDTYKDELEFLWGKFPGNAIWRNPKNKKWYALLMIVPARKLGIDSEEKVEVIDLRFAKGEAYEFAKSNDNVYPGYHMNKKNWITIVLNDTVPTEQIYGLIHQSYELSLRG